MSHDAPPPAGKPRFGAKGNSDAGVQLLWLLGNLAGGLLVVAGAGMMVRGEFSITKSFYTVTGAVVAAFGGLILGIIGYVRERFGRH